MVTDPLTLAYASPGSTPPAGTAFTIYERPDGVRLERPLRAALAMRVLLILAIGVAAAAAVGLVVRDATDRRPADPFGPTLASVAVLGGFVYFAVRLLPATWPRTQVIDLTGQTLTVVNGCWSFPNRERHLPVYGRFGTSLPSPDVLRMKLIADLWVQTGFASKRNLIRGLERAECHWAAGRLQAGYDRAAASAATAV